MPGVKITTSTLSGPTNIVGAPTARAFIAGITERGPVTPLTIHSIVDFNTYFGTLQSYSGAMYRAAQTFFAEGGAELTVCRAVGTTPTLATLSLVDRTAVTPLATCRIDAANAGAWGAGVTVQITAGGPANTITFQAFYLGVRVSYVKDCADTATLVTALANDPYVRATDLVPVSVYPTRLPAVVGPSALVGGNDDRATVTAAKVGTALDGAGLTFGAGAVAAPGYNATVIGAILITHCTTHRRIAILAGDVGSLTSDLITMAAALSANGQFAGVFGPWLVVPEGSSTAQVSPEGYILGVRARVMNQEGFWQVPAGGRAVANYVQGTVSTFDSVAIDALADGKVSGITNIGADTELYGWRSLSTNSAQFTLLNSQDVLNTLTELVERTLQPYVFETIDATGQLIGRVQGALTGVLQPITDAGGFVPQVDNQGNVTNPAYRVTVSASTDGTSIIATVTVRLAGVAETITVSIVKAAFNATI